MKLLCPSWLRWVCPFRRPPRPPALVMPPKASRLDFDVAKARLTGAALDSVDTAEFTAQGAISARNRVRGVGERVARTVEDQGENRATIGEDAMRVAEAALKFGHRDQ